MKQSSNEKCTIAWFKLAEFVSRGEKERALALYRLLAHSFADKALVVQLEGDLCASFKDTSAQEKYSQAAQLYVLDGRWWQAAALYEQLHMLDQTNIDYLNGLLVVYKQLNLPEQYVSAGQRLILLLIKKNVAVQDLLPFAHETIDQALELADSKRLDQYMKQIEEQHLELYTLLCGYLGLPS